MEARLAAVVEGRPLDLAWSSPWLRALAALARSVPMGLAAEPRGQKQDGEEVARATCEKRTEDLQKNTQIFKLEIQRNQSTQHQLSKCKFRIVKNPDGANQNRFFLHNKNMSLKYSSENEMSKFAIDRSCETVSATKVIELRADLETLELTRASDVEALGV